MSKWILNNPHDFVENVDIWNKPILLESATIERYSVRTYDCTIEPDSYYFSPCLTSSLPRAKSLIRKGVEPIKSGTRMQWEQVK